MAEPTATTTVAPQAPTTTAGFSGTVTPRIRTIGIERSPQKDMYHYVLKLSWPAFFGLVAIVFLFANLVFASAYLARPGSIANARPGSFENSTRAEGRENRVNVRPVMTAMPRIPVNASTTTSRCA